MYQNYNLKCKEALSAPPLNELSHQNDFRPALLSSPPPVMSETGTVKIKTAEQIKHIETNPSISHVLLASDWSDWIRRQKAIGPTDRGREGFQRQQQGGQADGHAFH